MLHIPAIHGAPRRTQVTTVSTAVVAVLVIALLFATATAAVAIAVTFGIVTLGVGATVMLYARQHREPLD